MKKNKRRNKNSSMAYFLKSDDIIPGYSPLSRNEEIIKCANIIANLVSNMTIMLMENGNGGDVRIHNHLSQVVDINPCPYMDRKNFIFKIVKELIIYGNSVVLPETKNGKLINMIPINIEECTFLKTEKGYQISHNGAIYQSDDVLHFVLNPKLDEPFEGEGYKTAIIDTVANLIQANTTKKRFLQSKWKPSLVISVSSDAEELQDNELRKKILGSYTDTTEEGEPWLIPAGEIDVKTIQPLTLNDLAIQDSITLDKKTIASAMQIPAFMVGIGDFNKEQYNNFISTTIMGFSKILEQQFTNKLITNYKWYWKFNRKTLMQYDLKEQMDFVKTMVECGMISRNEGRCEFDYAPVDNEGMNGYNVLENYIPVSEVGNQKKLIKENKDE